MEGAYKPYLQIYLSLSISLSLCLCLSVYLSLSLSVYVCLCMCVLVKSLSVTALDGLSDDRDFYCQHSHDECNLAVFNLWIVAPLEVVYQIFRISDIYITIPNSSKIAVVKQHKINLWLGVTAT